MRARAAIVGQGPGLRIGTCLGSDTSKPRRPVQRDCCTNTAALCNRPIRSGLIILYEVPDTIARERLRTPVERYH
jgi:hypothetical protein